MHDPKLRAGYLSQKPRGRDNFESEVRQQVKRAIDDCDRKIQRAKQRLLDEGGWAGTGWATVGARRIW